jgi:hypothetical protein
MAKQADTQARMAQREQRRLELEQRRLELKRAERPSALLVGRRVALAVVAAVVVIYVNFYSRFGMIAASKNPQVRQTSGWHAKGLPTPLFVLLIEAACVVVMVYGVMAPRNDDSCQRGGGGCLLSVMLIFGIGVFFLKCG